MDAIPEVAAWTWFVTVLFQPAILITKLLYGNNENCVIWFSPQYNLHLFHSYMSETRQLLTGICVILADHNLHQSRRYEKILYTLDIIVAIYHTFKGLKATNEREDDGTGILHQVAQHPMDQVYGYTRRPCPSRPRKTWRDKVLAAKQVGLYALPNAPPLALRGSWNMWAVNNYRSLSGALNVWNVIHHATTSPCPKNTTRQLSDIQVPN